MDSLLTINSAVGGFVECSNINNIIAITCIYNGIKKLANGINYNQISVQGNIAVTGT